MTTLYKQTTVQTVSLSFISNIKCKVKIIAYIYKNNTDSALGKNDGSFNRRFARERR